LRHLWIAIDQELIRDSKSEEWLQWGRDMVNSIYEAGAEFEARKNKEEGE